MKSLTIFSKKIIGIILIKFKYQKIKKLKKSKNGKYRGKEFRV
ncbi:hypothetical protein Cabys_974 [Caldithrix abyssi DSM 13497]|uniref:Uncharacterized protein n=1 Tax=Caldithrix abyssi DSM 13497 TaxID=880073 RepID=A0A1J1C4W3_CALAY|nr:hypothetical protein Cabys_974 [Caldithrix abyssi DSM 13497]